MSKRYPAFIKNCWWLEVERVNAMLAGDADAAMRVFVNLHNSDRGKLVAWIFKLGLPKPVLRKVLDQAWSHDHQPVLAAGRSLSRVLEWFRQAEFPVDHLPDRFPVWRGTSHLSLAQARRGLSWTTEKSIAAWFATRHCPLHQRDTVIVLRRDVTRDEVLWHSNERAEAEVLLAPGGGVVDGDPNEWDLLAEQQQIKRDAEWKQDLADMDRMVKARESAASAIN